MKTLRIDYRVDGEPRTATASDGAEVRLMTSVAPERPEAAIRTLDGKPVLVASRSGKYALTDASGKTVAVDVSDVPEPITVAGPWELRFPSGWDAPESILLDELISWPKHEHDGVKYFSGTAVYRKKLEIPADRLGPGKELVLDLGKVAVMAEVKLNGKDLGILWKPPFCVTITDVAKAGTNDLEVRVTNLWPNRLIGDERKPPYLKWKPDGGPAEWPDWLAEGGPVPETGRRTLTTWHHFTKDSPLLESGLLGPVTLRSAKVVAAPQSGL
ncbi:MAG TPA: hypothetical protein DD670_20025 [Planctomycetaceae bacterium]|nr:hypothetical protein [Planctomycetaceae bacterium]